ncbi:hypothetical protein D1AOALGA4SA_11713 [Olavius algarvensis Delta 1 endosymbiont]|nr:hypothetical protein D1AOALGA4SA_11713 [Olavius algarvensis Delta 1 endosymbiont]
MQIPNKSQTPIPNDQNRFAVWNFGHWKLFVFWDLLFGIFLNAATSPNHLINLFD